MSMLAVERAVGVVPKAVHRPQFGRNVENVGDGNDFQSLNPGEKIRVCKKKIEEYSAESATLLSERQALEKMMDVYSQNHALGDPNSIKEQLEVNAKSLDKSNEELHKYQCYLAAIQNTSPPSRQPFYSGHPGSTVPPQPTNGVSPPPGNVPEPPPPPSSAAVDNDDGEFEDDLHCYVLYDFQGTNEGEITVSAGEELIVLERDVDNTGWTQVLKGDDEG